MNTLDSRKPLVISLIIHGALMALLAFLMVRPQPAPQWHEILLSEPESMPAAPVKQPEVARVNEREDSPQPTGRGRSVPARTESPVPDVPSSPARPSPSELLETPVVTRPNPNSSSYSVGPNPYAQAALQGMLESQNPNTGGVETSDTGTGGKVSFRLPPGYKHSVGASGSVTVQFRINRYAQLVPGSIVSLQQTEGRFFEAAKKVLADGSFSFTGTPEAEVTCRMTLDFL